MRLLRNIVKAVAMSEDHKPNRPSEERRIRRAGGAVLNVQGIHRVAAAILFSIEQGLNEQLS